MPILKNSRELGVVEGNWGEEDPSQILAAFTGDDQGFWGFIFPLESPKKKKRTICGFQMSSGEEAAGWAQIWASPSLPRAALG